MAVAIEVQPNVITPAFNQMTVRAMSDAVSNPGFKYIIEVYINDIVEPVNTSTLYPRPDGYVNFDCSKIVQQYLTTNFINEITEGTIETLTSVYVRIYEFFGGVKEESATTNTWQVWSAAADWNEGKNLPVYADKFLAADGAIDYDTAKNYLGCRSYVLDDNSNRPWYSIRPTEKRVLSLLSLSKIPEPTGGKMFVINGASVNLTLETAEAYDFTIYWGDGQSEVLNSQYYNYIQHTYETSGVYEIYIGDGIEDVCTYVTDIDIAVGQGEEIVKINLDYTWLLLGKLRITNYTGIIDDLILPLPENAANLQSIIVESNLTSWNSTAYPNLYKLDLSVNDFTEVAMDNIVAYYYDNLISMQQLSILNLGTDSTPLSITGYEKAHLLDVSIPTFELTVPAQPIPAGTFQSFINTDILTYFDTLQLGIGTTDAELIIDWGDGYYQQYILDEDTTLSHKYKTAGQYITQISSADLANISMISIDGMNVFSNIDIDNFTTLTIYTLKNNSSLTNIIIPITSTYLQTLDFYGNALTETSVNDMLIMLDENIWLTGNGQSIDISGGTNSTPTGLGVTAKDNLILKGITVYTN